MKFTELPDNLKQKVLQKHWTININHEWWDLTVDNLEKQLEEDFGFSNVKISFSGFASQGDGASFTGELIDLKQFLEKTGINPTIHFRRGTSNYSHERTVSIDFEYLENEIEDWRIEKCQEIYRALEEEYDYLTSEEQIEERLIANDYDFDEEGEIV